MAIVDASISFSFIAANFFKFTHRFELSIDAKWKLLKISIFRKFGVHKRGAIIAIIAQNVIRFYEIYFLEKRSHFVNTRQLRLGIH